MIILIGGARGQGKTTIANIIKELIESKLDRPAMICSFASPLKHTAEHLAGWDGEKDTKGRQLLQQLGDACRAYNPDIFVERLLTSIQPFPRDAIVIVDDWRFDNESRFLRQRAREQVVSIHVCGRVNEIDKTVDAHTSETAARGLEYDLGYVNRGTLEELAAGIESLLETYIFLPEEYVHE